MYNVTNSDQYFIIFSNISHLAPRRPSQDNHLLHQYPASELFQWVQSQHLSQMMPRPLQMDLSYRCVQVSLPVYSSTDTCDLLCTTNFNFKASLPVEDAVANVNLCSLVGTGRLRGNYCLPQVVDLPVLQPLRSHLKLAWAFLETTLSSHVSVKKQESA